MRKKAIDKLRTKIAGFISEYESEGFIWQDNKIKYDNKLFLEFDEHSVKYNVWRYYPDRVLSIVKTDSKVTIFIEGKNFELLGSSIINPPLYARLIPHYFKEITGVSITHIIIGANNNKLNGSTLSITRNTYELLKDILSEETTGKKVRIQQRIAPIIESNFNIHIELSELNINYSLLLREILESGNYSQEDLITLTDRVNSGSGNKIVIEKQIKKQTQWLIDTLQSIIDEPNLNLAKAKNLGNRYFNYPKESIKGPEHLMEKILIDYGKNIFFGSPILISTKKYVISSKIKSRCQFDILLVNQLNDLEVVELKRPDKPILSYEPGRNKFYASQDLSISISQAERYLSSLIKDNDEEYLIEGKKIRKYLNDEIGGLAEIDIIRPSAIIIMGTFQMLTDPYDNLEPDKKAKIRKEDYEYNGLMAYKELKNAFKNIQIMSYSELIENARLRLL